MNPDPDYSAAYVVLRTDAGDGLEGHGLTFTIGRGTEVVVAARRGARGRWSSGARRRGARGRPRRASGGDLVGDSQLRWIGPEKGVIHLATAAVVNAVWDLCAKRAGKPLWQLLADMSPAEIVGLVDFRYLTDALTPDEALAHARAAPCPAGRSARRSCCATATRPTPRRSAGSATTTTRSGGSCREALADGWTRFKMKVGADVEDDVRRIADRPRGDRARTGCWRSTPTSAGTSARRSTGWRGWPRSTRTGSRSRPAPTTSSATPRSPGRSRPIRVATGEHVHNRIMFKQFLAGRGDRRLPDRRLPARRRQRGRRGAAAGGQVRRAGLPARRRRRPVRARPAPLGVRLRRGQRRGSTAG